MRDHPFPSSCAGVSVIDPSTIGGQTNLPRSKRFAKRCAFRWIVNVHHDVAPISTVRNPWAEARKRVERSLVLGVSLSGRLSGLLVGLWGQSRSYRRDNVGGMLGQIEVPAKEKNAAPEIVRVF